MENITILGSTGTIGSTTLSIVRNNNKLFKIIALVANKNINIMLQQCIEFLPKYVCMNDNKSAQELKYKLKQTSLYNKITVLYGTRATCELASLNEIDIVVSAIVGIHGLLPTLYAIKANKKILLANKESLVACGKIFMDTIKETNAKLLPIDSEHNGIFQTLPNEIKNNLGYENLNKFGIKSIILLGSGGPFLKRNKSTFKYITPKEALQHPNWKMGEKISIDSATMMNKGLEYIEARLLFNASEKEIEIVIHPQSIIHSMIRYCDGNIIAQMSTTNMYSAITYALSYPKRIKNNIEQLNFFKLNSLTFEKPDLMHYPCLKLAMNAFAQGQAATTALNAANDICVSAFLNNKISFIDIAIINEKVLSCLIFSEPNNIDDILEIDNWARQIANTFIN